MNGLVQFSIYQLILKVSLKLHIIPCIQFIKILLCKAMSKEEREERDLEQMQIPRRKRLNMDDSRADDDVEDDDDM